MPIAQRLAQPLIHRREPSTRSTDMARMNGYETAISKSSGVVPQGQIPEVHTILPQQVEGIEVGLPSVEWSSRYPARSTRLTNTVCIPTAEYGSSCAVSTPAGQRRYASPRRRCSVTGTGSRGARSAQFGRVLVRRPEEGLHVRGLRATAATRIQESDANEFDVKLHLGHSVKSMGITAR